MARKLTVVAVGLIILGAIAMAGPTFGFSTIGADRNTTVETANESGEALLGINSVGTTTTLTTGEEVTVATLKSNLNTHFTVEQDIVSTSDDFVVTEPIPGQEITTGGTDVLIECNNSDKGTQDVIFEVKRVGTEHISVEGTSFTTTVDYDCKSGGRGSGSANFDASNIENGEQTFTFDVGELTSNNEVRIDLSDPQGEGVDYTRAEVASTTKGSADLSDDGTQIVFTTATGNTNGDGEIIINNITVDDSSSDFYTVNYDDDRGREDSDGFQTP